MSARSMTRAASAVAGFGIVALATSCGSAPTPTPPKDPDAHHPDGAGGGTLCTSYAANPDKPAPTGDGPLVLRVVMRGAPSSRAMCDVLSTRAGARLDPVTIERDMHEVWKTGLVDDVYVAREPAPGGIVLAYELRAREEVTKVVLVGAPAGVSAADLEAELPTPGLVDPRRDWKAERSLLWELRGMGYRKATVDRKLIRDPAGGATLQFTLAPGKPTVVGKLELTGLSVLDPTRTAAELFTRVGAPVSDDAMERDTLVLSASGYDAGLLDVRVEPPRVVESEDGATANVTWAVTEGAVYRVGKVEFSGDLRGTPDEYLKLSRVPKKGDVFRRSDFASAIALVTAFHATKGETVNVVPETTIDRPHHTIDLKVVVTRAAPSP